MPDWRYAIQRRLEPLRLPAAREAEVVEELAQHLDDRYEELRSGGASDDEARRAALAEAHDADLVRELTGIAQPAVEPLALGGPQRAHAIGGLWQDLRFGARLLVKDAGASLVIVLTLGLAIAANAIVFGFADLLLIRPLPIGNATRLVSVYGLDHRSGDDRDALSVPEYLDIKAQSASFDNVTAMTRSELSLTGAGEPRVVAAMSVTPNLFRVWDVGAVAGRTLLPGDDRPGRDEAAVLAHRFWSATFSGDPAIVGRHISLNGRSYTVVGVLTPSIEIGTIGRIDLWLPLETSATAKRDERMLGVMGLLKPGATLASASAELATIAGRLQQVYPVTNAGRELRAMTLRESTAGGSTWILLSLLGVIVALVLLVTCANVATVMLARASARRREIAVRLALGATRARLVRQLVSEGLFVGVAGGVVGVLFAHAGLTGFKLLSPEPYFQLLRINANLLAFAAALSAIAPLVFGVVPALQSSQPDLSEDLKEGGREGVASRGNRLRSLLVVAQVSLALALLIVAGLVVRSVVHIERVALGVRPEGVLTVRVRLDPPKYNDDDARARATEAIVERLEAVPGVTAAAAMQGLPLLDPERSRQFLIDRRPAPRAADVPWAFEARTSRGYPRAMALPLLEGRMWRPDDRASSWAVAVVSREAVRRYWSGRSPLGAHIRVLDADGKPTDSIEVIGVVDDVKGQDLPQPSPPRLYQPLVRRPAASVAFAVRTEGDPALLAPAVRGALRAVDRDLATSDVQRFDEMMALRFRTFSLIIAMFTGFATIGLVVAVTGVYGVTAFSVGQRRREIGVRIALGATSADVARLIVGHSFRLMAVGACLGVVAGWALGLTIRGSLLFGVGAADPLTYTLVLGLLAVSGLVASYVPAHRAMSIDPMTVLKRE
jgi:putative ABC transport system permease protein